VILAAGIIFLLEIIAGRTNYVWRLVPESHINSFLAIEELIIAKNPQPSILIFGNSRARGAFLPTQMEEEMGLQRGQVLNLAMGGQRPIHALKMYQRNREILARADIVIIELDSWQFGVDIPSPELDLYRFVAGWTDVLAYKGSNRNSLMRSLLFRLPDTIPYLREYVKLLISQEGRIKPIGIDKYGRPDLVLIANDYDEKSFQEETIMYLLDWGYKHYEYSREAENDLIELVRLAKADGAKVFILQLPFPEIYVELIKRYPTNPHERFRKNIATSMNDLADCVQFWDYHTDVGLNDLDFREIGHLNTGGAIKWTTFFVQWLEQKMDNELQNKLKNQQ
jgi:hypothetical protein